MVHRLHSDNNSYDNFQWHYLSLWLGRMLFLKLQYNWYTMTVNNYSGTTQFFFFKYSVIYLPFLTIIQNEDSRNAVLINTWENMWNEGRNQLSKSNSLQMMYIENISTHDFCQYQSTYVWEHLTEQNQGGLILLLPVKLALCLLSVAEYVRSPIHHHFCSASVSIMSHKTARICGRHILRDVFNMSMLGAACIEDNR